MHNQPMASQRNSRTSHEVRGLKFYIDTPDRLQCSRRTSHEVRGLKYVRAYWDNADILSHLTRGAWIEI